VYRTAVDRIYSDGAVGAERIVLNLFAGVVRVRVREQSKVKAADARALAHAGIQHAPAHSRRRRLADEEAAMLLKCFRNTAARTWRFAHATYCAGMHGSHMLDVELQGLVSGELIYAVLEPACMEGTCRECRSSSRFSLAPSVTKRDQHELRHELTTEITFFSVAISYFFVMLCSARVRCCLLS